MLSKLNVLNWADILTSSYIKLGVEALVSSESPGYFY